MNQRAQRIIQRTECLLLMAGTLCAAICLIVAIEAVQARRVSAQIMQQGAAQKGQDAEHAIKVESDPETNAQASVIGNLKIQQLGLSVPIMSDYQAASLLKGIGHIPGTAMPGGLGTVGLAGHRDTYFRPLRGIKKDMDIQLASQTGTYHYAVDSTEIVTPDHVEVLAIGAHPGLTLITCYPFYYVGSAPKRFIVHAHLVSALPD
jgi:sortase A